jgi:hypothetical protein
LREEIRANAERLAAEAGVQIEFIRKLKAFRKEDRVQAILAQRGEHPGLVHIFSAMEPAPLSALVRQGERTHHAQAASGKCLHYYFYFIDADFGLCYLRVPTWAPFRLQVYCNGHGWLARQLAQAGIGFAMADNAFLSIADPRAPPSVSPTASMPRACIAISRTGTQRFCPLRPHFRNGVHWSFMQVEYASDVVFQRQASFQPLYEAIVRTAVHVVKAEHVATFLGHKLSAHYQGEVGNDFSTRIQGTRIRHHMGPASIKLYDKAGIIARVECTANDVSFFKHHRYVEQRNGETVFKLAPLRKWRRHSSSSALSIGAWRARSAPSCDRHASRLVGASPTVALGRREHVGEGKGARRNSPRALRRRRLARPLLDGSQ